MNFSTPLPFLAIMLCCSSTLAQLPDQLILDFEESSDYDPAEWLFVAPTPLGVTQADPDQVVSVGGGDWVWSIQSPNEVLVGVYDSLNLKNSAVETSFDFDGSGGISIGFLNRFGSVPDPVDPDTNPRLAHGYCTLVSPETITLIDFDFARDPADYIRALSQVPTPDGLFTGAQTNVIFQTLDEPSAADASVIVPTFDFWLGGTHIFDGVEDANASWASGYAGVDVWTVDPFAQATSNAFTVNFDSLVIRGEPVPEPSGIMLCSIAGLAAIRLRRRRPALGASH